MLAEGASDTPTLQVCSSETSPCFHVQHFNLLHPLCPSDTAAVRPARGVSSDVEVTVAGRPVGESCGTTSGPSVCAGASDGSSGREMVDSDGERNGELAEHQTLLAAGSSGQMVTRATQNVNRKPFFRIVNHSRIVWDPKAKPKGLLGGHFNIRSIISKTEQIHHLLLNSNLDYLCLSETWLYKNAPSAALNITGYNIHRRDREGAKGGGVMIYIKDTIQCHERAEWS